MIWLIVALILFINPTSIETIKSKCNNYIPSISYSLSSDLNTSSLVKPVNCLLQSEISIIERDHFNEYLNFTLISYAIGESEVRSIGLQLTKPISSANPTSSSILYSCAKLNSGLTSAKVTIETFSQPIGSSIYLNGNLYCSWIASRNDLIWPIDGSKRADLVNDNSYQLYLQLNGSKVMVANQSTSLPIYRRQYVQNRCQYKALGESNYQLITKRSTNGQIIDFMLQFSDSNPDVIQLILNQSNETTLIVECSLSDNIIKFYATIGFETIYLSGNLKERKIFDNQCSWTLPGKILVNNKLTINIDSVKFKSIQIVADRLTVFNQSNVNLTGFSWQLTSNLLIVLLSIIFSVSI